MRCALPPRGQLSIQGQQDGSQKGNDRRRSFWQTASSRLCRMGTQQRPEGSFPLASLAAGRLGEQITAKEEVTNELCIKRNLKTGKFPHS